MTDSFLMPHTGVELAIELAGMLNLVPSSVMLDVASGKGTSAFAVAERFGCRVIGVDLSDANVAQANAEAAKRGLSDRVHFLLVDAEELPFEPSSFNAVLCECAFCTFPDKTKAAAKFSRVLWARGRVGISDLTRVADPLPELDGLLAWIACITSWPKAEYIIGNPPFLGKPYLYTSCMILAPGTYRPSEMPMKGWWRPESISACTGGTNLPQPSRMEVPGRPV